MGRSDENNPGVIGPVRSQGGVRMGGEKMVSDLGNHRRALASINPNLVGAPVYPTMNKRGLAEKHPLCDKIPPIPVHRPVTRKFAAQLAHKEHEPCVKVLPSEVARKTAPFTTNPSEYQDCTIIDVDEYESESDPVPMYVKHTEAMLDEIDQMEEVEMEDAAVDPDMDIDSCDADNPLAVVDYIDDIYAHYWNTESSSFVSPTYMSFQSDINEKMRGILIDWLIEVHYKFELMDETLFLTVNLIDRFLAMQTMDRKKLQLVGVTAMLLACKYEEVSVPVVDDLILISDKAYTRKEVLAMEKLMVNTLQFNMSVPTPYVFMRRLLKAAQSDMKHELLSFFIIELCLVEYEMLKFPPSLLAAAAIFTAQCTMDKFKHWSKTCTWHSRYSQDQLMECSKLMVAFHQKASAGRLTAVHKKYSTFKFGYAAKAEPACFLLQTNF